MKNRLVPTLAVALLMAAGVSTTALAQDRPAAAANPDKTQVVPGRDDLKPNPPTVKKMDDNAQRIHDRDNAAAPQGRAADGKTTATAGQPARMAPPEVRDWAAIDKNKDNLISPEEMEAALKPSAAPATPTAAPK